MFKRILVPTDGSRLSQQAARAVVELARNLSADVVGFVATPEDKMRVIEDAVFAPGTLSEADFSKAVKRKEVSWRDREDGAGCGCSVQRGVGNQ